MILKELTNQKFNEKVQNKKKENEKRKKNYEK